MPSLNRLHEESLDWYSDRCGSRCARLSVGVFSIWACLIPSSTELFCFVRQKITVQSSVIARENSDENSFQMQGDNKSDLRAAGVSRNVVSA